MPRMPELTLRSKDPSSRHSSSVRPLNEKTRANSRRIQPSRNRRVLKTSAAGWLFILPGLLSLTLFLFIPAGYVLYLSFQRWNLLTANPQFVGFRNYIHLASSPDFQQAIANTVWFGLFLLLILIPLGLFLAVLLDMGLKGTRIYRTILFAPYVVPLVASGLAFSLMYNPDFGLIDQILALFHISGPDWLGSSTLALPSVIAMTVWQYLGYYVIIFLAGLQNISHTLKEAAAVDGAGAQQTFWRVILPNLSPSLFFASVICTIQSFQTFDQVYAMTQGGPAGATSTVVYYIFMQGFQMYNIGTASAASIVLLIFLALLTWLQVLFSRRWVVYE